MRLGKRQSSNVEDRRGGGGKRAAGISTLLIALAVSYFFGVDPATVVNTLEGGAASTAQTSAGTPQDEAGRFVSAVLADTEDTWGALFQAHGQNYPAPGLVLYTGQTPTSCGTGQAASGPFYCPLDRKIYLDLSFYDLMRTRFGVNGDFAQAYVIAHEVGHHVQNVTGVLDRFHTERQRISEREANALSVKVELQADCYAGIWAHHANRSRGILEAGDIEEGINAAAAVGDDALQQAAGGRVVPDSFTHGSSEQRVAAFRQGLESGQVDTCRF